MNALVFALSVILLAGPLFAQQARRLSFDSVPTSSSFQKG